MAQCFRALAVSEEGQGSNPSTHPEQFTTDRLVPGNQTASSDLCRHQAHTWYIHIQASETLVHINTIDKSLKHFNVNMGVRT